MDMRREQDGGREIAPRPWDEAGRALQPGAPPPPPWRGPPTNRLASATIVLLLVVGGAVLGAAFVLLREMRAMHAQSEAIAKQLDQLRQVARESGAVLNAATQLAHANHAAADAAGQALQAAQRAWLVARPPESLDVMARPLRIETVFANQGATAARDVVLRYGQTVFQDTKGFQADYAHAPRADGGAPGAIAAHGEKRVGYASEGADPEDLSSLTTGHGSLAVYGGVTYEDTYGKPHFTHFCRMFQFDTSGRQVRAEACPTWNDSD